MVLWLTRGAGQALTDVGPGEDFRCDSEMEAEQRTDSTWHPFPQGPL